MPDTYPLRVDSECPPNPFLPFDEDFFVTDISDTHVCLLNKFNVVDYHILIVARSFEGQESLLTLKTWGQIFSCLSNDSFSLVPRKMFSLPCNKNRLGECPGKARNPRSLIQGLRGCPRLD